MSKELGNHAERDYYPERLLAKDKTIWASLQTIIQQSKIWISLNLQVHNNTFQVKPIGQVWSMTGDQSIKLETSK